MNDFRLFSHIDMDGIGCNVVAKLIMGENNVVATNHNYDTVDKAVLEFLHSNKLRNFKYVFITDLSVSDETAERIDGYLKSGRVMPQIVLLDHHKSAERLNKYDWCHVSETDSDGWPTCGTTLLYNWFLENIVHDPKDFFEELDCNRVSLSYFVQMVRDWDTWEWKNNAYSWGETAKELNDLFTIYGKDKFVPWAINKINRTESGFDFDWTETEMLLLEQRKKEIENYVKQKDENLIKYNFSDFGWLAGVTFSDRFSSELGNALCELHPELDFIVMINLSNGTASLSANKKEVDVSRIAEMYGGGGHPQAAGIKLDKHFAEDVVGQLFDRITW